MSIHRYLHFRGMSQKAIAEAIGLPENSFSQICQGRKLLPIDVVPELADLLLVDVERVVRAFLATREDFLNANPD